MALKRIDRMSEPPIVGQFYLVPIVHAKYFGHANDWPVLGPRHEDSDFFSFKIQHYHVDFRFVPCSNRVAAERHPYVLHGSAEGRHAGPVDIPSGPPVLRRRKCVRSRLQFRIPAGNVKTDPLDHLRAHFAGQECPRSKGGGWICPHRAAPLGSIEPVDGIITCPLHGLRIDAATGKVMPTLAQAVYGVRR
jgi:nitrite reductase/ring-hydroxylating ferredoxin subunit